MKKLLVYIMGIYTHKNIKVASLGPIHNNELSKVLQPYTHEIFHEYIS